MEMKCYILETRRDGGTFYVKTYNSSVRVAIDNFCNLYHAPRNAVKNIYEIPIGFFGYNSKNLIKKGIAVKIN